MTPYEKGFFTKCAEHGLNYNESVAIAKLYGGLTKTAKEKICEKYLEKRAQVPRQAMGLVTRAGNFLRRAGNAFTGNGGKLFRAADNAVTGKGGSLFRRFGDAFTGRGVANAQQALNDANSALSQMRGNVNHLYGLERARRSALRSFGRSGGPFYDLDQSWKRFAEARNAVDAFRLQNPNLVAKFKIMSDSVNGLKRNLQSARRLQTRARVGAGVLGAGLGGAGLYGLYRYGRNAFGQGPTR